MLLPAPSREANAELCRRKNFVSAHLPFDFFAVHFRPFGYKSIVTIRNPVDHLRSQIAHIVRDKTALHDEEQIFIKKSLAKDPNNFIASATRERLDFLRAMQSRTIFGSSNDRIGNHALDRVSWILENYDSVVLTEDADDLHRYITIEGDKLEFPPPNENLRPASQEIELDLSDKVLDLLESDFIIYEEIKKINNISNKYWKQLIR
ncbi:MULTISPECIES: hypothetical protein [unclassified Methylobacterium]|uniref:hypothetical protein n=1 Tax=unclassified Methylobacterium TaxID=2615210 RepID=UPI0011C20314|nr:MULTISPECIES: hypothetical protein [unclassified Methylobacterium]QEE39031.1 hypothetical protein FVA80_08795 [Methylobacterium sp. WL1]TXN54170.1 hypothetical protein FV241_25210 [Methylobacterium sp. WL2]